MAPRDCSSRARGIERRHKGVELMWRIMLRGLRYDVVREPALREGDRRRYNTPISKR